MPNSDSDPYLQVLVGIASELSAIRQELQKANAGGGEADVETFDCKCGEEILGASNARQHARAEHAAPADHWEEMYA